MDLIILKFSFAHWYGEETEDPFRFEKITTAVPFLSISER